MYIKYACHIINIDSSRLFLIDLSLKRDSFSGTPRSTLVMFIYRSEKKLLRKSIDRRELYAIEYQQK